MKYITLCSGIECVSVAALPLGWTPICFSEIEPFPSAVLAHHYPEVPNVGDMTTHDWSQYRGRCDALIAGTPCQAFSVAGKGGSLDDERGNLTLKFAEICDDIDPRVIVWENVPGVLGTKDNAFGCLLGALVGESAPIVPHGKWTNAGLVVGPRRTVAWRILDAQFFGVAQRRRRVFLVASPRGSGINPAEILFESDGVRRDSPPSRGEEKSVAAGAGDGAAGSGEWGGVAKCLLAKHSSRHSPSDETFVVAGTVTARGVDGMRLGNSFDLQGGLQAVGAICADSFTGGASGRPEGAAAGHFIPMVAGTLSNNGKAAGSATQQDANQGLLMPISFHPSQDPIVGGNVSHALGCGSSGGQASVAVTSGLAVRRLIPEECELLQGLPRDYTRIPWRGRPAKNCPDGPRYKAIGNGMATVCIGWVLRRIDIAAAFANSA